MPCRLEKFAAGLIMLSVLGLPFAVAQAPKPAFLAETWPWKPPDGAVFPDGEWKKLESPAIAGRQVRGAAHIVKDAEHHGNDGDRGRLCSLRVGDVARVSKTPSVRKSVLGILMGNYIANGKIDLHKTVGGIGLDDMWPFQPTEETATLADVIQSRSGIYLDADRWAKRGANAPGTVMHYNNWDFNAAGTTFEKLTGHDIFDALETDLARPPGMQDFDRKKQQKNQTVPEEKISVHPEYAMYLSTRDMARLGLLMLRDGKWKDRQVMPRNWAAYLTTLYTPASQVGPAWVRQDLNSGPMRWGYGALWWVWDAPRGANQASWMQFTGMFSAMGTDGQYITVIPTKDMVVVHMSSSMEESPERNVNHFEYQTILQMLLDAHCCDNCK